MTDNTFGSMYMFCIKIRHLLLVRVGKFGMVYFLKPSRNFWQIRLKTTTCGLTEFDR